MAETIFKAIDENGGVIAVSFCKDDINHFIFNASTSLDLIEDSFSPSACDYLNELEKWELDIDDHMRECKICQVINEISELTEMIRLGEI